MTRKPHPPESYLPPGVSYDDLEDAKHLDQTPRDEIIDVMWMVFGGIVMLICGGLAVLAVVVAVQWARDSAAFISPTAAEVAAPGFSLESKVAEVQP